MKERCYSRVSSAVAFAPTFRDGGACGDILEERLVSTAPPSQPQLRFREELLQFLALPLGGAVVHHNSGCSRAACARDPWMNRTKARSQSGSYPVEEEVPWMRETLAAPEQLCGTIKVRRTLPCVLRFPGFHLEYDSRMNT